MDAQGCAALILKLHPLEGEITIENLATPPQVTCTRVRSEVEQVVSRLNKGPKLVPEILCHHQTMYAAVHDADAHTPEVSLQDVGAMSGRAHYTRVRDLQGCGESE